MTIAIQRSATIFGSLALVFSVACGGEPLTTSGSTSGAGGGSSTTTTGQGGSTTGAGEGGGGSTASSSSTGGGDPGVYAFALSDPGDTISEMKTLLDAPGMDGIALRLSWAELEPTLGMYDWTSLDSALAEVQARSKKATIHVFGPGGGPLDPKWFAGLGVQTYVYTDKNTQKQITVPVPWDPTFLGKWAEFVAAFGAHLTASGYLPSVLNVSIPVPTSEMNLRGCSQGMLGDVPYDAAAYLAAWQQTADAYQAAFPTTKKLISAPTGGFICGPAKDLTFYVKLMDYALAKGDFGMFAADLTALGSARASDYPNVGAKTSVGLQPIWSSLNDPTNRMKGSFLDAVCAGHALGANYFEVYKVDVLNQGEAPSGTATIETAIKAVHDQSLCAAK